MQKVNDLIGSLDLDWILWGKTKRLEAPDTGAVSSKDLPPPVGEENFDENNEDEDQSISQDAGNSTEIHDQR